MSTILITGANGQVGSYLAKEYHKEGHRLILFYHKRIERLSGLTTDNNCYLQAVDLCNYSKVQEATNDACKHLSCTPDVLIHCAAMRSFDAKALASSDPAVFSQVFNANLYGAYNILHNVLSKMQENGFGRVILMGSDVSKTGLAYGSAYAASKAAMVNMMKSAAREYRADNITINAISPAPIDTNLEEDYSGEYLEFRKAYFDKYLTDNPGASLVKISEIKRLTDLLMDAELNNLNGQELFLSGGNI
jgi:NAD(P)-dependent dehydrogenase (short-subunit alcohol dehydrogenase family)